VCPPPNFEILATPLNLPVSEHIGPPTFLPPAKRRGIYVRSCLFVCLSVRGYTQRRHQENSSGGGASFSLGADTDPPFPIPPLPRPSPPFPSPLVPFPPLRSRLPKIQLGGLGERCNSPSEVWGGAPADKRFDAF